MLGNAFLGVFAKSPLKPVEAHSRLINPFCQFELLFFQALLAQMIDKIGLFSDIAEQVALRFKMMLAE